MFRNLLYSRFYLLIIIFCIGMLILIQYPASSVEDLEFQLDDQGKSEIQSYDEFCQAVYWEDMAERSAIETEKTSNYNKAKSHFEEAIRLNPNSSYLYSKLALVLINLREGNRRTYSIARKSVELNPDNPEGHYAVGILEFARGEREAAIREFKKTTELKPSHLEAQSRLARMLFDDLDFKGAAEAYAEIVKLRPYIPELRVQLGKSYSMSGQTEEAIREFTNVLMLNNGLLDAHFHLAYLYTRQSRYDEAIEECQTVLKFAPGNPDMSLLLGDIYVSIGRYDDAIVVLESVLKHGKVEKVMLAEANYRLATAYKGKNDPAQANIYFRNAIDTYKEIMNTEKDNVGLNYDLAMVYEAMGDFDNAEKYLRKHIELKPDEPNAYNFLGYMFAENNMKLLEAVDLIKKAVEIQPENGAFRDSLGWAYFKMGDIEQAIAELQKALELLPYDGDIRIHLGEVYLKKGGDFTAKALSEWEKAVEMKPNDLALQKRLEELRNKTARTVISDQ